MKTILSIALTCLISQATFAQEGNKNSVSVDLLRGLTMEQEVYRWLFQYERAINRNFSGVIAFETGQFEHYSKTESSVSTGQVYNSEEYTVSGNMLLVEARYYPFTKNKVAPRGFFLGTYFKNYWLKEQISSNDDSKSFQKNHSLSAIGLDFGYQMFSGLFMMEPVLGFGTAWHSGIGEDSRVDRQMGGFESSNYSIRLAINIGVCF